MYKIILVSHGDLAEAMYRTAELIAGKHEGVETFGLHLGDDVEAFRSTVESAIERAVKTDELLVLSDVQSGSPFNVAVGAMIPPCDGDESRHGGRGVGRLPEHDA